jgi:hypothetical protein
MPPRGSGGYDFTPVVTHYRKQPSRLGSVSILNLTFHKVFLFTTILAVVSPHPIGFRDPTKTAFDIL